ncbi:MAG: ATP-binding protein [Chloroflexi bacterium]|jgi:predicted AAA+ superfamily ATPase|nr:ATP-binding protein [Chloroflexota bacterium]
MYIQRQLEEVILRSSRTFPALLLTGPRQSGKSTLLHHLAEDNRIYVTLDDPAVRDVAKTAPELFFQQFKPPMVLDEVQYAPQLFPYIKMIIDERNENGLFWMTGSQLFEMMWNVQESLAGRVSLLNLYGFSQAEKENRKVSAFPPPLEELIEAYKNMPMKTTAEIFEIIWQGSMPRVFTESEIDLDSFYISYTQTYLTRDVKLITNISDEVQFLRFIRLIAARTAQELNLTALARELSVSANTCRNWLDILIATGLVVEMPAYSGNLSDRLIKRPKIFFMDTGLACYLTGWSDVRALQSSAYSGAIFETWVVSEILKSWWYNGKKPQFTYYRDRLLKEIDLIIPRNMQILPFEIKKSTSPSHAMKNFPAIEKLNAEVGFGGVLSMSPNLLPISENKWMIPVSLL